MVSKEGKQAHSDMNDAWGRLQVLFSLWTPFTVAQLQSAVNIIRGARK